MELLEKEVKIFGLFRNQWALVTAGNKDKFNSCTVSWGSMGTLWTKDKESGSMITVYLHPARYTCEFLKNEEYFTVSFFDPEYKKALGVMGSTSGRDIDKVEKSGLTPIEIDNQITYKEAKTTYLCRKVYQHQFSKEDIAVDVQEYYKSKPQAYPLDENGQWQPHYMFIGEIVKEIKN